MTNATKAKAAAKNSTTEELQIRTIREGRVTFLLKGETPLVYNAMSMKVRQLLLCPPKKETKTQQNSRLKHDPIQEYRDSVYRHIGDEHATRLMFPSTAFKAALMRVASDAGQKGDKGKVGRTVYVEGDSVDVYGIPKLWMSIVRCAGQARTPDVRTRAIIPNWCAKVTVRFQEPFLNVTNIVDLFASAGRLCGIGDFRQEKGAGNYGRWDLVEANDLDFNRLAEYGGRDAQDDALANPELYDHETVQLMEWFQAEAATRGFEPTK